MHHVARLLCVAGAIAALAWLPAASGAAAAPDARDVSFYAPSVRGRIGIEVYLPAGYEAAAPRRYPVLYFLHGLPAATTSYRSARFVARSLASQSRPAILVAPQGARDGDPDPEYLDWGNGRDWETAVSVDVPRFVDAHFRTVANRAGRGLVGVSAGGYGAVSVALHHLGAFSVIESWSGYFHPTDPGGWNTLDLGSRAANTRASVHRAVPKLRRAFSQQPTFLAFYVGRDDARFHDENVELHRELTAAHVPHVFHVYAGGHQQNVFATHAAPWLALALDHLARAR